MELVNRREEIFIINYFDELVSAFLSFKRENADFENSELVDFLGINLSSDLKKTPVFKIYYTTKKSINDLPPLLDLFVEKQMIRAVNLVHDSINEGKIRYELGLKNRTNQNMEAVYQWIYTASPETKKHKNEIEKLRTIQCTDDTKYRYAALYFLGIIADVQKSKSTKVNAVKLHYLLRHCNNSEKIGTDYIIDNKFYLKLLFEMSITEITEVATIIKKLLESVEGTLCIVAVDYYSRGYVKYKIYLKECGEAMCSRMVDIFAEKGLHILAQRIRCYVQWLHLHPELRLYGLAVCLDNLGSWSINFYH